MKQSNSRSSPTREDFAVEEFGEEALVVRLADMHLFRLNRQALTLFELLLESNGNAIAALEAAKEQNAALDSEDIESVQKILFSSENDFKELQ